MPDNFSLVICGGPPGSTRGGRAVLLSVMGANLAADCIVLQWQDEPGGSFETPGRREPSIPMPLKDAA